MLGNFAVGIFFSLLSPEASRKDAGHGPSPSDLRGAFEQKQLKALKADSLVVVTAGMQCGRVVRYRGPADVTGISAGTGSLLAEVKDHDGHATVLPLLSLRPPHVRCIAAFDHAHRDRNCLG